MFRLSQFLRFVANMSSRPTPNPDCLQFRPLAPLEGVLPPNTPPVDVPYRSLAQIHPLAEMLFDHYEGEVRSVFLAEDYVAVTKWSDIRWNIELERSICSLIGQFLLTHDAVPPLRSADVDDLDDSFKIHAGTDSEVMQCVKELLRKEVRPMVQRDGGDIRLMEFNETTGVVKLKMLGACRSCPSSQNTLKEGVERLLQHYVPEVKEVVEHKTAQDEELDEMSKVRSAAAAEAEEKKNKKSKKQGSNHDEGKDDDDSSSSDTGKNKMAAIAVSFGSGETITATAGWNVRQQHSQHVENDNTMMMMEQQQQKAEETEAIRKQLESLGVATMAATAMPKSASLRDSTNLSSTSSYDEDLLKSRGFMSFPQQPAGDDKHGNKKNKNNKHFFTGGLSAEDMEIARQREQEIEAALAKEAAEKKAKMESMRRAHRRKLAKEVGFGEPDG